MKTILLIDNYDSFTYNLQHLVLSEFSGRVIIKRNDTPLSQFNGDYSALIISPGPKSPGQSGISMALIDKFHKNIPILGICLGMQCLNEFFGGKTIFSPKPLHGKTSFIHHNGHPLFDAIPQTFPAARYHSLAISPGNQSFVIAESSKGLPMALTHAKLPLYGLQFHPESFMTPQGRTIIKNFLKLSGL